MKIFRSADVCFVFPGVYGVVDDKFNHIINLTESILCVNLYEERQAKQWKDKSEMSFRSELLYSIVNADFS